MALTRRSQPVTVRKRPVLSPAPQPGLPQSGPVDLSKPAITPTMQTTRSKLPAPPSFRPVSPPPSRRTASGQKDKKPGGPSTEGDKIGGVPIDFPVLDRLLKKYPNNRDRAYKEYAEHIKGQSGAVGNVQLTPKQQAELMERLREGVTLPPLQQVGIPPAQAGGLPNIMPNQDGVSVGFSYPNPSVTLTGRKGPVDAHLRVPIKPNLQLSDVKWMARVKTGEITVGLNKKGVALGTVLPGGIKARIVTLTKEGKMDGLLKALLLFPKETVVSYGKKYGISAGVAYAKGLMKDAPDDLFVQGIIESILKPWLRKWEKAARQKERNEYAKKIADAKRQKVEDEKGFKEDEVILADLVEKHKDKDGKVDMDAVYKAFKATRE